MDPELLAILCLALAYVYLYWRLDLAEQRIQRLTQLRCRCKH